MPEMKKAPTLWAWRRRPRRPGALERVASEHSSAGLQTLSTRQGLPGLLRHAPQRLALLTLSNGLIFSHAQSVFHHF